MSADKEWDGVYCADKKMPGWYVWSFIATIIIGIVYLLNYHVMTGWTSAGEFTAAQAEHEAKYGKTELAPTGGNPFRGDADAIAAGQKTFSGICAACHGPEGLGNIGPNLMDDEWLHGTTEDEVFDVVFNGRQSPDQWKQNPAKGPMPAHGGMLGAEGVWKVLAFLESKNSTIKASN